MTPYALNHLREAFAPGTWSNWTLALVACWAGRIALRTMKAIQLQAAAQMNADRAWVLMREIRNPPALFECLDQHISPGVVFRIRVSGNTPGRIIRERYRCHIVPAVPGTQPPEPKLDPEPTFTTPAGNVAGPGEEVKAPGDDYLMNVILETGLMMDVEFSDLLHGRSILCAYGCIEYKDAFGRDGLTTFCVAYRFQTGGVIKSPDGTGLNVAGFRIAGPAPYNVTK